MITKEQIKSTGATFTPKELADFLSLRLIRYITKDERIRVLDPACGEGELLVSIAEKLKGTKKNFTLTGYDSNTNYLNVANERLSHVGIKKCNFITDDFLEVVDIQDKQISLSFSETKEFKINGSFDLVVANPPYVRTQILGSEQSQKLSKKFNLKGRVDLYYPFLISMTESLRDDGLLGVITSNRYLSTKSGESVRKFLASNFQILELIDLGDTKLFNAAVLPAIFIGRKRRGVKQTYGLFTKVYEELNGYNGTLIDEDNIYDVLHSNRSGYFQVGTKKYKKTNGLLKCHDGSRPWEMLSQSETEWISKIESVMKNRVEDFFKVRVGIKTTADKVFISDNWERLGSEIPEEELLKELISQENVQPWNVGNLSLKVLYPHYSKEGEKFTVNIKKYPRALKYLSLHREKLESRKYLIDAGRKWFEIWVPQRAELWARPKIIFPDISSTPRFCYDDTGRIVNGNCYWIVANSKEDVSRLFLIQGIANSKLMTKYHDLVFNNKLYSGRRRYFSQYVERYPLPDINSESSQAIIDIVKELNMINCSQETKLLEQALEVKIAEAFGVEPILNLD